MSALNVLLLGPARHASIVKDISTSNTRKTAGDAAGANIWIGCNQSHEMAERLSGHRGRVDPRCEDPAFLGGGGL
jgi:hypothetical protein